MKPETVQDVILKLLGHDDGVEFGDGYHDDCKQELEEALAQIQQLLEECAPEMRTDTRGATQNPDNQKYLTKAAMAHNQAIDQYKSNIRGKMR